MEKNEIDIILEKEEVVRKKLINKVIFIILSMIFILVGIIVVEFKEYSNNYNEYKIGKADLGPKDLVWAGIMGTPPRYYESDTKYGLGYSEFSTREIRKALESAGFNLVYRYMSPNRLEFEFERKHPICFYDRKWKNPKEYFKTPKHPILSIPLYYSGNGPKKIVFRKGERAKFEKHLDSKGNIILDSLIKDASLKTELIRKVEYDGPYSKVTYGKQQLDGTYYDFVKQKYQKNIDLIILHTNDQIIQMLTVKKRFDYQFYETLEYDDYVWGKGGTKGIETLTYEEPVVQDLDDPDLTFHSVACGNHPLAKKAMPIINEVIHTVRFNNKIKIRNRLYEKKLNPLDSLSVNGPSFTSIQSLGEFLFKADKWYFEQFEKMKIQKWPMFNTRNDVPLEDIKRKITNNPYWMLIEKINQFGEKTLLVTNEVELKNRAEELILKEDFLDNIETNIQRVIVDKNEYFKDLKFSTISEIQKIVIFARGIKNEEFKLLNPILRKKELKSLTLIQSSFSQSHEIIKLLASESEKWEQIRFHDVPLLGIPVENTIKKLINLKSLNIHSSSVPLDQFWVNNNELIRIFDDLSENIEDLSFIGREDTLRNSHFSIKIAEIFSRKNFSKLKSLRLSNFFLSDLHLELITRALPITLESFIIENSGSTGGISLLLLEEFLKNRMSVNKLKRLRLKGMLFSMRNDNILYLPKSLEDFSLVNTIGLNDGNIHRIVISPKTKLKRLKINNNLNDGSIVNFLKFLNDKIEILDLKENNLSGKIFITIKDNIHPIEIDKLSLRSNPIDDLGIWGLSQLPWKIKNLDISNLKMTDSSVKYFLSSKMKLNLKDLKSLDISDNYLNSKGVSQLLEKYGKHLTSLKLNNILSLDVNNLSKLLPKDLEILSVSGNMLDDESISTLAKVLPENLSYLDISGSRMGAIGAYELAKHMPKLTSFYFDFRYGEENMGLTYLLQNISSYLINISDFSDGLSCKNSSLFAKHMPSYLYYLSIPKLEKEECIDIISSLPSSLRSLVLRNNLSLLSQNYPSHLLRLALGNSIDKNERDTFLKNHPFVDLRVTNAINVITHQYIKSKTLFLFSLVGTLKPEYFKGINFHTCFEIRGKQKNDIPKDFLNSINESQISDIDILLIHNAPLDSKEIIDFLKKTPPLLLSLSLININIKKDDVDQIIKVLPKNLRFLNVKENPYGEEGSRKFKEFKAYMEEKTGLPFSLIENE